MPRIVYERSPPVTRLTFTFERDDMKNVREFYITIGSHYSVREFFAGDLWNGSHLVLATTAPSVIGHTRGYTVRITWQSQSNIPRQINKSLSAESVDLVHDCSRDRQRFLRARYRWQTLHDCHTIGTIFHSPRFYVPARTQIDRPSRVAGRTVRSVSHRVSARTDYHYHCFPSPLVSRHSVVAC